MLILRSLNSDHSTLASRQCVTLNIYCALKKYLFSHKIFTGSLTKVVRFLVCLFVFFKQEAILLGGKRGELGLRHWKGRENAILEVGEGLGVQSHFQIRLKTRLVMGTRLAQHDGNMAPNGHWWAICQLLRGWYWALGELKTQVIHLVLVLRQLHQHLKLHLVASQNQLKITCVGICTECQAQVVGVPWRMMWPWMVMCYKLSTRKP